MNNNLWYKPEKQYDAKERYEKHHREFINKIKNYGWQNVLNGYNQTSMWDNNIWSNNLLKGFGTDYDALSGKNFSVGQGVKYAQNNFNDIATDISYSDTNNRNVDYYFNRDKSDLCKNEGGFIPYAYLDTAQPPRATIGCGVNIEETPNIKLYNHQTGKRLNDKEINAEINKLKKAHLYNAKPSFYENKLIFVLRLKKMSI